MSMHVEETTFFIVFEGELLPGHTKDEAVNNLAKIFKTDTSRIAQRLFSGKRVVISRNLSEEEAVRRKKILNRAGAKCKIFSHIKNDKVPPPADKHGTTKRRISRLAATATLLLAVVVPGLLYLAGQGELTVFAEDSPKGKANGTFDDSNPVDNRGMDDGTYTKYPGREALLEMLQKKQFKDIENLAIQYYKSRMILDSGNRASTQIYFDLGYIKRGTGESYERRIPLLEEWMSKAPDSPVPPNILARLTQNKAHEVRGPGLYSSLGRKQKVQFKELSEKAFKQASTPAALKDTYNYATRIGILAFSGSPDEALKLFEEAYERDPFYVPVYESTIMALTERFGGDARMIHELLGKYASGHRGIEDERTFILALDYSLFYYNELNLFNKLGFSWKEDVKANCELLLDKTPTDKRVMNACWFLAGIALDPDAMQKYAEHLDRTSGWMLENMYYKDWQLEYIRSTYDNSDRIIPFTLDASSLWHESDIQAWLKTPTALRSAAPPEGRGEDLVSYYDLLDPETGKEIGPPRQRRSHPSKDIAWYFDSSRMVFLAEVPRDLAMEGIKVRYTVEVSLDPEDKVSSTKVYSRDTVLNGEKLTHMRKFRRSAVSPTGPLLLNTNLLEDPHARVGEPIWSFYGESGTKTLAKDRTVFVNNNSFGSPSHISQNVFLPPEAAGTYLVLAAYTSVDKTLPGSISWHPAIKGQVMKDKNQSIQPLSSVMHKCNDFCWEPLVSITKLPEGTEHVSVFFEQAMSGTENTREHYNKAVPAYFADPELRLFSTLRDATKFAKGYLNNYKPPTRHQQEQLAEIEAVLANTEKSGNTTAPKENLLKNPSAEDDLNNWQYKTGLSHALPYRDGRRVFGIKSRGQGFAFLSQFVDMKGYSNKYAVLAGYVSTDYQPPGSSAFSPYFNVSFTQGKDFKTLSYFEIMGESCGPHCWYTISDIKQVPEAATKVSIALYPQDYMNKKLLEGAPKRTITGFADDLELRVFDTKKEAEAFLLSYKKNHPRKQL